MGVMQDLERLSAAEEFFDYLDVPYEPELLRVNRLHIMRQLGNLLHDEDMRGAEDDEALRVSFREKLSRAYDDLSNEGPMSRRLFKVHQDAVKPKPPEAPASNFVPLSTIVEPGGSGQS